MIHYTPEVTTMLRAIYAEEGRHYHGLNHIKHLLANANEWHQTGAIDNSELQLLEHAIWWHDASYSIYSPLGVNETESRMMFTEYLTRGDIKLSQINGWTFADAKMIVSKAIDATAHHLQDQTFEGYPGTSVIYGMLDVDLCGFAESFEVVKYNNELIIKEHERKQIPRATILANTATFLNKLLDRNRIFYTDYFYEKCEVIARENIFKLIVELLAEMAELAKEAVDKTIAATKADVDARLAVGNGYYHREGERSDSNPIYRNAKRFVNHAGLTGRVGEGSDRWILFFDDGTIFYSLHIDNLTFVD